jgi:PhzF family phenazine biosynthesis protein
VARPDLIRPPVVLYLAFSEVASGGSPAGVAVDASELDAETMQQMAAEVGAPATCFVTGFADGIIDVRFFSTTTEYGMCGHGTVGLVTSLVEQEVVVPGADGRVDLVVRSTGGTVEVEVRRRQDGRPEVWMDLAPAFFEPSGVDPAEVAAWLGVAIDSLDSCLPIERTVSDFTHLIVPLQDLSAMAAVAPDFDGLAGWCRRIGVDTVALIVTEVADDDHDYRCRDLCPAVGTDEAAATGTTNRALACWLVRQDLLGVGVDGHHVLVAGQGIEMGRPSAVCSEVEVVSGRVDRVRIGGVATRIGL